MLIFDFRGRRVWCAVGSDKSVAVEVVVGGGIAAVIASISEDFFSFAVGVAHGLVYKVPNKSTLVLRFATNEIPVFFETTHRVTHGVGIFALDERPFIFAFEIVLAAFGRNVHGAEDVRGTLQPGTFVLYGACLVPLLEIVVDAVEVHTMPGFVTHAPRDDGGMVFEHFHVVEIALQVGLVKFGAACQRTFSITHAVGFEVGFGHNIQPHFIAQFVPTRVVGVVGGAHGIDVVLLHDADILLHALHTHHVSAVGVHLVAVGAFDEERHAIHTELSKRLSVVRGRKQFNFAEAHFARATFHHPALSIEQVERKGVEMGRFGRPGLHAFHRPFQLPTPLSIEGLSVSGDHSTPTVAEGGAEPVAFGTGGGHVEGEAAVAVVVFKVGHIAEIGNLCLRTSKKVDLAGNPREAPKVLILKVRAVAPAHHLHGDEVLLAGTQVGREVKLCRYFRILRIAHPAAVHPHAEVARGRPYVQVDAFALPCGRNFHLFAVRPRVVIALFDEGRIVFELRGPSIADVLVDGHTVAVEFEDARHGKILPRPVIVVGAFEADGPLVVVLVEAEAPLPFEREVALRLSLVAAEGQIGIFVSKEVVVRRKGIDAVDVGIAPRLFGRRLCCEGQCGRGEHQPEEERKKSVFHGEKRKRSRGKNT